VVADRFGEHVEDVGDGVAVGASSCDDGWL
jgi:hypothetical protein